MANLDPPNDIEIANAKRGNTDALSTVLTKTSPYVLSLCKKWCRPPLESEDIAQESLITLAKKINTYRSESAFFTWVYSLTYRTFLDFARKENRRKNIAKMQSLDSLDSAPNKVESVPAFDGRSDEHQKLLVALSQLEPKHSEVLALIDIEEKSYTEVANELAIPVGTVRSRLSRARINLRDLLVKNGTLTSIDDVKEIEE